MADMKPTCSQCGSEVYDEDELAEVPHEHLLCITCRVDLDNKIGPIVDELMSDPAVVKAMAALDEEEG